VPKFISEAKAEKLKAKFLKDWPEIAALLRALK
jgi:hypothetical protein